MAAIIDDMVGMTLFVTGVKSFYASINLHVDFVSNVRCGTSVIATSEIIKKGSRIMLVACNLYGPDKTLLAKGSSNLVMTEGSDYSQSVA